MTTDKDRRTFKMSNWEKPALGIICLMIFAVILVAGLWPFNFNPHNKVEWLQDRNGIRFYGQGIVKLSDPPAFQKSFNNGNSISIEFLIRPEKERSNYIASILTFVDSQGDETFIIGQWRTHLIIRSLLDDGNGRRRYYEWGLDNVLQKNIVRLITISSGPGGTDLYLDGVWKNFYPGNLRLTAVQGNKSNMILGTSSTGERYWLGSILGLAIFNRTLNSKEILDHYHAWQQRGLLLPATERPKSRQKDEIFYRKDAKEISSSVEKSFQKSSQPEPSPKQTTGLVSDSSIPDALYLFDEHSGERIRNHTYDQSHLQIPATFKPLRRTMLGMPGKGQWFKLWNLMDVAINILGFIPLGFFLSAWLQQAKKFSAARVYSISILVGFCVSLSIELTQAYLPTRDSSLLDVINNTLGTAIGAFLLKYGLPIVHKYLGKRSKHIGYKSEKN